jgi:ketosteroid isomerase-like protein
MLKNKKSWEDEKVLECTPSGVMPEIGNIGYVVKKRIMKIATVAFFLLVIAQLVIAQDFSPQLQSMVNAENSFARLSKEKNMRDAFLANLTDSTILYTKDGPRKGKQIWIDRAPGNNLLFWWPLFVGISAGNDLGFSTGPWQWSESKESQPVAHGYFVSVWKKVDGEWKLATDSGSSMPGPEPSEGKLHSSNPTINQGVNKNILQHIMTVDAQYNKQVKLSEAAFKSEAFSGDAMLKYPRSFPDYYPFESNTNISKPDFQSHGGEVSRSNDLAYVYGRVYATMENNGAKGQVNFLRVWKYEKDGWKIVIEVIADPQ